MAETGKIIVDGVFEFERTTKNTVRYFEKPKTGEPPKIGPLYIQKWALENSPPERVAVIVMVDRRRKQEPVKEERRERPYLYPEDDGATTPTGGSGV